MKCHQNQKLIRRANILEVHEGPSGLLSRKVFLRLEIELYLLYPVSAGSKGVYVVVDPMNEIVESDEKDNVKPIPEELESSSPVLDLAREVVGKTALPFAVIVLTIALLGVVYLVGKGRRDEVNKRLAEQSSLVSVLADELES